MKYSVIVFDTAPTGHTLRFLSFPTVLEKALAKISGLSGRFGPMFQQVSGMMGLNANQEDMFSKLEEMRSVITEVNNQFKDPVSISSVMAWFVSYSWACRIPPRSSAFAFPSSCPCMRPNA